MQPRDLASHRDAHLRIEIRERLVEQENLWLSDDCPTECDALTLTSGELARFPVEIFVEAERPRCDLDALVDLLGRHVSEPEREAKILAHRQDRKSTRLNSSHPSISYAVFCLKKKK